jgi:hypothetical protein
MPITIIQLYNIFINYIKNNPNKKEVIKGIWIYLTRMNKYYLYNIIILDKIKDKITNYDLDKKIKLLTDIKLNNKCSNKLFNIIFKDINDIDYKKMKYLINKEIFLRKPLEEQEIIRKKIREKIRDNYNLMTASEKKQYNLNKRKKNIMKHGLEGYRSKLREQYNKWYNNLTPYQLENIRIKRRKRYEYLPREIKERYKKNRLNSLNTKTHEEKQKILNRYKENRKKKFNSLSEEEKQNKLIIIRRNKVDYFRNLPKERIKFYYRLKTEYRRYKKGQIELNDYTRLKDELYFKLCNNKY